MENLIIAIETESDVTLIRKQAEERAQAMGFTDLACAEVALGVSEIVRNVVRYANAGKAFISSSKKRVLRIEIKDHGDGIDNIEEARQEGFSSDNSSLGVGLSVAERAFNFFSIESVAGVGTVVVLEKYLPYPSECVRYGSASIRDERYEVNGDVFLIKEFDGNKILLAVIDGVGQGKEARTVANRVLSVINNKYRLPLNEIILACDRRLRKDELEGGATIALALVVENTLYYIGIGDTHSYLYNGEITLLKNQDGRLGEFKLPVLVIQKYAIDGLTNIILCSDGINTHLPEKLLEPFSDPQQQANYIFNNHHRLYGDATVLVAQYESGHL